MPAQETTQPQSEQMAVPTSAEQTTMQQPRPVDNMTAEPVSMRGGGGGDLCCGLCAGLACFECCEICC